MSVSNLYFILRRPEEATVSMLKHVVGTEDTQRHSKDGKFVVVKLPIGAEIPASFQNLKAYSHSEILDVLHTDPNWISPEII